MSRSYLEICDLALMCQLGVSTDEHTFPQKVFVSLRIYADYSVSEVSDDLSDTIDYKNVVTSLRQMTEAKKFRLIETLARSIRDHVLAVSPATAVTVKVRKPNVLMEAGAVSYNLVT